MFLEYYGLREQPFGVTPNPRYLYHSAMHREALASLIYGIESDLGFTALIADPGMGKTTLLFYLLEKFRNTARTALIFQTLCTPLELLRYLANELEIKTNEVDAVSLNERIKEVLVQEARAKRRVIVIIDEAQNLDEPVLETVRLLSDFETQNKKLMHIILAGQLQLAEKLARPGMAQLLQRVSMLNRLAALNADETKNYIEYRLGVAGYHSPTLFTPEAVKRVAQMSGGVPRKINRICFNALSLGCAVGKKTIDEDVVREVGNDLDIGDLLFQKGAITSEPASAESAALEKPGDAERRVLEVSQVKPPVRKAETASVEHKTDIVPIQPVAQESPIREALPARELPKIPTPVPQPPPAVRVQSVAKAPEYVVPRPSATATTVSGHVRPFVPPIVPAAGVARPLSSAQAKPVSVASPSLVSSPAVVQSAAPSQSPKVLPIRAKAPKRSLRVAILASSAVLIAVVAFTAWTLWGNVGGHGASTAQARSVLPQAQTEVPASSGSYMSLDEAISRGRAAAKERGTTASPQNEPVRVSAERAQPQAQRRAPETREAKLDPAPSPARADQAISAALLRKVQPIYPAEARRSGLQGSVTVSAVIGTDGKPRKVHALSGNPILARAAIDAVSQWLYQPYSVNGRPVEVETEVVVDFALR